MDIRNISRVLVFRKALNTYNKKGSNLSSAQVYILSSIYTLGSCNPSQLQTYLKSFFRTYSPKQILDYIQPLIGSGLIEVKGSWPTLYTLTLEGKNTLLELEKRVRETRRDR